MSSGTRQGKTGIAGGLVLQPTSDEGMDLNLDSQGWSGRDSALGGVKDQHQAIDEV